VSTSTGQPNVNGDKIIPRERDGVIDSLDESKLYKPHVGYKWQILKEINAAFQMPANWHYLHQDSDGQLSYFLTKENFKKEGSFQTGLSVIAIRKSNERLGKDAIKHAREVISEMMRSTDTIATGVGQITYMFQYSCRSRIEDSNGIMKIVDVQTFGNVRTDTYYKVTFEYPEHLSEESEKIAPRMLMYFTIDDEI
jgi:hypothetical protein